MGLLKCLHRCVKPLVQVSSLHSQPDLQESAEATTE